MAETSETYARLRRGADLGQVLANVRRIQRWKLKLGSELPYLDSCFVVMRSSFREIPRYFSLMADHPRKHFPRAHAGRDESIADRAEVRELHAAAV